MLDWPNSTHNDGFPTTAPVDSVLRRDRVYPDVSLDELPAALRSRVVELSERWGYVPDDPSSVPPNRLLG